MAAKRFLNESDSDMDRPTDKRMRTKPTFASVIGEAVALHSLQNLCSGLEPLLRRVVNEEVDRILRRSSRSFTSSPSMRIEALESSRFQLRFSENLSLPIFTGNRILGAQNSPLQILLVDTNSDQIANQAILSHPIKVEIVVLDGNFTPNHCDSWTSDEFESNIVRERAGKRPLLTGDVLVTVRDRIAAIGDIEFTDNSSWIRSRKFRIGARVVSGSSQGVRIREAMTEPFVVKDHRGELYKKHHPPMLNDEVWRLEKIGKDGAFHRKLASDGINTVQDFLKLSIVDPSKLRGILGTMMSEKMWEVTINHARTCIMGNKNYIFRGSNYIIFMNPICQVIKAMINGQMYATRELTGINKAHIERLAREAYRNWNSLEEIDENLNEATLLTQGDMVDQYQNNDDQQNMVKLFQVNLNLSEKAMELEYPKPTSIRVMNPIYMSGTRESDDGYFSDSSPDGHLTPSFIRRI